MKIVPVDTVYCKAEFPNLLRVKELSFKKTFWTRGKFSKEENEYDSYLVSRKGLFLAGFLPRIVSFCQSKKLQIEVEPLEHDIKPQSITPQIQLDEEQLRVVTLLLENSRGVLISPTGSGKTVMAAAIASAFPKSRVLFLCHTTSLLKQSKIEFDRFGVGPASVYFSGEKDLSGRVVVSTVQSFSEELLLGLMTISFDVIIVDEAHHVSYADFSLENRKKKKGVSDSKTWYHKVLTSLVAPVRYGVTATADPALERYLAMEGLLGPVVSETTLERSKELGRITELKVELISVPPCPDVQRGAPYAETYRDCIVKYRLRNRMIIEAALKKAKQGLSSVIYVEKIEHGERLFDIAERMGLPVYFVRGETKVEEREKIRLMLNDKKILCVIASVVWKEGVNVRELDGVILASGGKKELAVIQAAGRALRRTDNKSEAFLIDFVDQGRYLAEHFVSRLAVYLENKWL